MENDIKINNLVKVHLAELEDLRTKNDSMKLKLQQFTKYHEVNIATKETEIREIHKVYQDQIDDIIKKHKETLILKDADRAKAEKENKDAIELYNNLNKTLDNELKDLKHELTEKAEQLATFSRLSVKNGPEKDCLDCKEKTMNSTTKFYTKIINDFGQRENSRSFKCKVCGESFTRATQLCFHTIAAYNAKEVTERKFNVKICLLKHTS